MNRIFIETYGCPANKNDSEIMLGLLSQRGFEFTTFDEADYILINTCGVKSATEEKIIHRLKQLSETDKKIIVAGCLTKINLERIKNVIPNFFAAIDPQSVHMIGDVIDRANNGESHLVHFSKESEQKPVLPKKSFNSLISIIQLSEGCLSNCSFCATKLARGDLVSFRPQLIRDQIEKGLKSGFREFHLTSEDSGAYGRDLDVNLADLIQSIDRIPGKFFVRIGMMNPLHFKTTVELKELIDSYESEKVFKFLHLCVQSGSDRILNLMKRGYKVKDFLKYVKEFRGEIPQLTLSTDIIVGYPTETGPDFKKTVDLIEKVKPDVVNISKFGARPGTKASKSEQLDRKTVNKRSSELYRLVKKTGLEKNKEWIGWKGEVLVDKKVDDGFFGRNFAYKPIFISTEEKIFGKFLEVEISDAAKNFLIAKTKTI